LATESFPIIKMHKSFVIILLSWAVAVYSSDLEAVVVGVLPSGREDTVAAFDGDNSMYIMGGYDGMNLFHEIYQFNLSQHGAIHEIAYFPVGITEGTLGKDGKGAFYYIGGDVGGRSRDIWRMTPENMTPEVVGQLPEPNRLSCSASDGMGNIYIVGGAEGNMEVRRNIVKYDTTLNVATVVASLPIGLYGASCAWLDGSVYIFGGVNTNFTHNMDILEYTPATGVVKSLDMQFSSNGLVFSSALTIGRHIYIVGGLTPNSAIHHVTKFSPITMTLDYYNVPSIEHLYAGISTIYVQASHRIYAVGGFTFLNNLTERLDEIFYIQLDWTL